MGLMHENNGQPEDRSGPVWDDLSQKTKLLYSNSGSTTPV